MSRVEPNPVLDLVAVRRRMQAAAEVARLPLRSHRWAGAAGGMLGHGTGNSLDFQDQRAYAPGDDPRHINWQAYARTGSYTMKLYRQEVSPKVDVMLDVSASMFVSAEKTLRTWETVYWCVESALQLGASLRVMVLTGSRWNEVPMPEVMAGEWRLPETAAGAPVMPVLHQVPLRPGSLRVLVSDLLFPGAPESITVPLTAGRGRGVVLAVYAKEEATPEWDGNVEFEDCETTLTEKRRVDAGILQRYQQAYTRHFALWREPCARLGIAFARVAAEPSFLDALRTEGVAAGACDQ